MDGNGFLSKSPTITDEGPTSCGWLAVPFRQFKCKRRRDQKQIYYEQESPRS